VLLKSWAFAEINGVFEQLLDTGSSPA
jgi:hypothetical protein